MHVAVLFVGVVMSFCFTSLTLSSEDEELSNYAKFNIITFIFYQLGKRFDEHMKVFASITEGDRNSSQILRKFD